MKYPTQVSDYLWWLLCLLWVTHDTSQGDRWSPGDSHWTQQRGEISRSVQSCFGDVFQSWLSTRCGWMRIAALPGTVWECVAGMCVCPKIFRNFEVPPKIPLDNRSCSYLLAINPRFSDTHPHMWAKLLTFFKQMQVAFLFGILKNRWLIIN